MQYCIKILFALLSIYNVERNHCTLRNKNTLPPNYCRLHFYNKRTTNSILHLIPFLKKIIYYYYLKRSAVHG